MIISDTDVASAVFTSSTMPEMADLSVEILPTGKISGLARKIHQYARNFGFVLVYKAILNFLLLTVCYRTRLRVFGLISTISTAHVRSDATMAAFTLSSTPEMADLGAKTLPTGKISGLESLTNALYY